MDPFELSHNLGVGISRKMNLYIKKAFINGRRLFGTPLAQSPKGYRSVEDYFFDTNLLTDGAPPNDRGCRACGKIGHLVADCPRKKSADNRKRQDKDRREKQAQNRIKEKSRNEQHQEAEPRGHLKKTQSDLPGIVDPIPAKSPQHKTPKKDPFPQNGRQHHQLESPVHHQGIPCPPGDSPFGAGLLQGNMPGGPLLIGPPIGGISARSPLPPGVIPINFNGIPPHGQLGRPQLQRLQSPPIANNTGNADMDAFAAFAKQMPVEELMKTETADTKSKMQSQRPATITGAINAEDLEASFLTKGPQGPPPPGFGAIQLGHILSQLGPPVHPQGQQNVDQLHMLQRQLQQQPLGILPPSGLIGGLLPGQEPQLAPLPGLGFTGQSPLPQQPAGDSLGIQSLASLGPPGSIMMPMIRPPFGLPNMGLMPFSPPSQPLSGDPLPPHTSPTPPTGGAPPALSPLLWPTTTANSFGPIIGPRPPFANKDSGFPSSVLFPEDLHHPLLSPSTIYPRAATENPETKQAASDLASGSPSTPPNMDIHTFTFED